MEASSTSSRFRFRDHNSDMEKASPSVTDSDVSSASSDGDDDESDLASMTGRGIKHLCSELLELKLASNEEFHKNIFSNYAAFIRIFNEAERLETELGQLKDHISTQKRLIRELVDVTCTKVSVSEETTSPIIEDFECSEPIPLNEFEDHMNNISERLDFVLFEKNLDEALDVIEFEDENLRRKKVEGTFALDDLSLFYDSAISERKGALTLELTLLAENPRITAPELQKALSGLYRLGEAHLADELMLKYYHARIETGIRDLQRSERFYNGVYIRELAKVVFSLIAQAARSFAMLNGDTNLYTKELIQWSLGEACVYIDCFNQYIKSISEVSEGLSTAVQAAQVSMSFCSLLETQGLMLLPYVIHHIRTSMEGVLHSQLEHFKKVIAIFTTADSWDLGRYLVPEITNEECNPMILGQEPEYCLLTSSGWKFLTLVQAFTEDVTPLVALQMEDSIFSGLINLFKDYVAILERALIQVTENDDPRINLAVSLPQQISILANLSTLEQLFPRMVRAIYEGLRMVNSDDTKEHTIISYQEKELDSFTLFTQEASSQLRFRFCYQYIHRIMSNEISYKFSPEVRSEGMPSVTFQVLFLELRKLERLGEDNVFGKEWILELQRELVEITFIQIATKKDMWTTTEENLARENSINNKQQFVMDLQFLAEITKYGGYFSNNPLVFADLIKSACLSVGLIPERDVNDNSYELDSVNEVIQNLIESEKTTLLIKDIEESMSVLGVEALEDESEIAVKSAASLGDHLLEEDIRSTIINLKDSSTSLGIITCESLSHDHEADDETNISTEKYDLPSLPLSVDVVEEGDNNDINQDVPSL
ncbi:Exocyst component Exo84, C-terminal [Parasponia andersonii]|uniref:Exocyst component Exo84, C-terminal n=1 Tax=Parasponia andersonii TaxID=3476 RepID=A0A2P5ADZ5_PARAD|nr:Exocyst component Exo84, C-terminal [Parasponia andersonii]